MARLRDVVVDCHRPAPLARFWASVLDGYEVAPYDDAELARLRAIGIAGPEDDPTVLVQPKGPGRRDRGPRMWFQRVPEPRRGKNRVHVDLSAGDGAFEAELSRLESLGATRAGDQPNSALVVLHDPEGNEFCLLRPGVHPPSGDGGPSGSVSA